MTVVTALLVCTESGRSHDSFIGEGHVMFAYLHSGGGAHRVTSCQASGEVCTRPAQSATSTTEFNRRQPTGRFAPNRLLVLHYSVLVLRTPPYCLPRMCFATDPTPETSWASFFHMHSSNPQSASHQRDQRDQRAGPLETRTQKAAEGNAVPA